MENQMPHGKCRKGKEQRKEPGGRYKVLKHLHARTHQQELADALPDANEPMHVGGKNAATHRPVRDAVESA
jgi:hypothetical protein